MWPLERIVRSNAEFRTRADFAELYASFEGLLFFGGYGGGDQFAYIGDVVVVWDHETDEHWQVADGLRDYLIKALNSAGDWYDE